MKIGMRHLHLFILLFTVCSLLVHSPSDFEAFAGTSDGAINSTVEINDSTENGPALADLDRFGYSVANMGDLDGDGVIDFAVGAPYTHVPKSANGNGWCCGGNLSGGSYPDRGTVYILFMDTDGSVKSTVAIDDATENGPVLYNNDAFGYSVANIGDLDNDGVNDLAVGAHLDDNGGSNRGAVHIMFMNTDGSVKSTVEINDSTENGPTLADHDQFGIAIAEVGDFDDNGTIELVVGAHLDNMDENGVQISLLQPMPSASAIEPKKLHDEAADLCSKYQKRLFGLACIPPQIGRDNYFELADYCINKLGFIGLKYHCLFHGGGARNPQAQYCWDAGKEFSVPVTIHTGLGIPLALPSLYLPIFQNYPEVDFVLAHAGAWITVEEASLVSKMCPNVYIDTSWQYPQTLLGIIKD